jgi:hypothetical protein
MSAERTFVTPAGSEPGPGMDRGPLGWVRSGPRGPGTVPGREGVRIVAAERQGAIVCEVTETG